MDTFAYARSNVSVKDGANYVDVLVPLQNTKSNIGNIKFGKSS